MLLYLGLLVTDWNIYFVAFSYRWELKKKISGEWWHHRVVNLVGVQPESMIVPLFVLFFPHNYRALMTAKWAPSSRIARKKDCTTIKCSPFFYLESGNSKLWITEEWLSCPLQGKYLRKIKIGKDVVNQVNILCRIHLTGRYGIGIWDPCDKKK